MGIIIKDNVELKRIADTLHDQGKRIVTTNGVYDIIHVGHIRCLQFCKEQGDVLIVGVNADSSVKQYKGDKRPIIGQDDRAELVASLSCVDFVYIFEERTPGAWLDIVKPHVHVKAGDYTLDRSKETPNTKIWERDVVEKNKGICMLAPLIQGRSTTAIIERIKEVYGSPKLCSAIFLDRDGTIIEDRGYMHKVEDIEFIPGSVEALKKLNQAGFKTIILSNQSGIARGKFSETDYYKFNQAFLSCLSDLGFHPHSVYFCPHHPDGQIEQYKKDCLCRKPRIGMAITAIKEHNIDLENSYMIGDKTSDILMGNRLGIKSILVKTGKAGLDREYEARPDYTAASLKEAVEIILS